MKGYRRAMRTYRWLWFVSGPVLWDLLWVPMVEASQERRRQRRAHRAAA